jgi:cell division protein FtsQ
MAFAAFLIAIGAFVLIALDIPTKAATSAGAAIGRAGFTVNGYQIVGLNRMKRALADEVIVDELRRAADSTSSGKPAQPLVDVSRIRQRLLQFGWVKDARVSRRLPDTLGIDIVERSPAALWQDKQRLALIDAEGVVLDRVTVDQMPDLPLLIGPGANGQARGLNQLMSDVPTLKPQLASATWIGRRRWDLNFQTGETIALPEGEAAAKAALVKFAKVDRSAGLLGRGLVRFDLRIPGKMIVRLPRAPGEAIAAEAPAEG